MFKSTRHVKKPSQPLEYALRLLAQRAYSQKKLTEKLESREVGAEGIKRVIDKLKELGYIDDSKFAKDFVENSQNIRLSGKRKIYWQLIKKGISKEVVEDAISTSYMEDNEGVAVSVLIKKYARNIPKNKLYERLVRRLISRGYNYQVVKKEVAKFIKNSG